MKIAKLFLGSFVLSCISLSAVALKDFCVPGTCSFNSLSKEGDVAYFYCDAAPEVTKVSFQDHNVNVKGANSNGEINITRFAVRKLNRYYFAVVPDLTRSKFALQTVTLKADGKVSCSIGKGDRTFQFAGVFNIL